MALSAAPPLPSVLHDTSNDPEELRHVIGALRVRCAWQARALRAAHVANEALTQRAADLADRAAQRVAAQTETTQQEQGEVIVSLRTQRAQLANQLELAQRAYETEATTVRELRVRLEDARRAASRWQQENEALRKALVENNRRQATGSTVPSTSTETTSVAASPALTTTSATTTDTDEARARRILKRASIAFGTKLEPVAAPPPTSSNDIDEARARRASKRASLAFGPNGTLSLAAARQAGTRPPHHHTRTVSSYTSPSVLNGGDGSPPLSASSVTISDRKLRGLSLLGEPSGLTMSPRTTSPTVPVVSSPVAESPGGASSFLASARETLPPLGSVIGLGVRMTTEEKLQTSPLSPSESQQSGVASTSRQPPSSTTSVDTEEAADVARRRSRMLGTGQPPASTERLQAQLTARSTELERVRSELARTRTELEHVREDQGASEVCLRALKAYVATLPPPERLDQGRNTDTTVPTSSAIPTESSGTAAWSSKWESALRWRRKGPDPSASPVPLPNHERSTTLKVDSEPSRTAGRTRPVPHQDLDDASKGTSLSLTDEANDEIPL